MAHHILACLIALTFLVSSTGSLSAAQALQPLTSAQGGFGVVQLPPSAFPASAFPAASAGLPVTKPAGKLSARLEALANAPRLRMLPE